MHSARSYCYFSMSFSYVLCMQLSDLLLWLNAHVTILCISESDIIADLWKSIVVHYFFIK